MHRSVRSIAGELFLRFCLIYELTDVSPGQAGKNEGGFARRRVTFFCVRNLTKCTPKPGPGHALDARVQVPGKSIAAVVVVVVPLVGKGAFVHSLATDDFSERPDKRPRSRVVQQKGECNKCRGSIGLC